jgi:hypothetical protein
VSLHTNTTQPQFSSLLSVISNKAPTFVEHHGGGGGGGGGGSSGVGTTASHRPRDRDREGSSKVEAKEAREREKMDKKERKKWNKLKNRTLGDSTSPTNSITSIASLVTPSGVGAKGGIEVPRRPDRVPPPPQQQLDPRGGEAGLDAATIARRTTAAAIAAAAASVANGIGGAAPGGDSTSHHGAGYSFSPAHMEESGGAPHTSHRYHSSRSSCACAVTRVRVRVRWRVCQQKNDLQVSVAERGEEAEGEGPADQPSEQQRARPLRLVVGRRGARPVERRRLLAVRGAHALQSRPRVLLVAVDRRRHQAQHRFVTHQL